MKKYYYTIGEVSNLLQIKPHVIRYWETEFPQLKPKKTPGGNRKFTENDIEIIKKISDMLHRQKYTIEGTRKKLREEKIRNTQKKINFESPFETAKNKIINDLLSLKQILQK